MLRNGPPRIAVLGGGIAGLSAAFRLAELSAKFERPLDITLFERGDRLGGPLCTIRDRGFIAEAGADSFLTEKPQALDLARRLGLADQVVPTRAEFRRTWVVRKGALAEIPEGFSLLAPARLMPMLRSPLLSPLGRLRVMIEPLIPRRKDSGDESLASFVRRRLGREVLDRIAQPLAGGIYTADPEQLSLRATLPRFAEMESRYGSVIRGMRAAARSSSAASGGASGARWSLFASLRGGIGMLVESLGQRLGDKVRLGAEAVALEAIDSGPVGRGPRWRLALAGGVALEVDAVICAVPAFAAALILRSCAPPLSRALAEIGYASAAVVNIAWREQDFIRTPRGFGFVAPLTERRKIIAGSFTSLKFEGRAPAGAILARGFIGGALQTDMMALNDDQMLKVTREEFRDLLGITAAPLWWRVNRWPESMPQYSLGHLQRVAQICGLGAALPGFELAGAAYHGVGIPDCILGGERAAQAIFSGLHPEIAEARAGSQ